MRGAGKKSEKWEKEYFKYIGKKEKENRGSEGESRVPRIKQGLERGKGGFW